MHQCLLLLGLLLQFSLLCKANPNRIKAKDLPDSYYEAGNWPSYTVEMSKKGMFEDIFKAGIKPYYFRGMEKTLVEFRHVKVSFKDAEGLLTPEFEVERGWLFPQTTGRLSKIELFSQPLTFTDARRVATKWFSLMGKSKSDLDAFFQVVKDDPLAWDSDWGSKSGKATNYSGGWNGPGGEFWALQFIKNYSEDVPFRMIFRIGYSLTMTDVERISFYEEKIPAPTGFEIEENPAIFGPDSSVYYMRAKGIKRK